MARRGRATVNFDFEFQYSQGGKFETASGLDIEEPGRKYLSFHNRVESWIANAMFKMAQKIDDLQAVMDSVDADEAREKVEEQGGIGQLGFLRGVMDPEEYDRFFNYILKHLTNTPMCRIAGTDIRVSDEYWDVIEEAGGIAALEQVVGQYLDFFGVSGPPQKPKKQKSPQKNGTGSFPVSV